MKSLSELLTKYENQHLQQSNKIAHYIGIPAVIIGVLLLLSWVSVSFGKAFHISFAWIAVAALLVYYFLLNVKLACAMTVVLIVLTLICTAIAYPSPTKFSLILFLILFIGGWVVLFIGHGMEKSKPAFVQSVIQMFVAPLFLLIEMLRILKLEKFFELASITKTANNQPADDDYPGT